MKAEYTIIKNKLRAQMALCSCSIEYEKGSGGVEKIIIQDLYFIRRELEVINKIIGDRYTYKITVATDGGTQITITNKVIDGPTLEEEVNAYTKKQEKKNSNVT